MRFQLQLETGVLPFTNVFKWEGFLECSAGIGNWCGIANLYPCIVQSQIGQPCTKVSNDQSFNYLNREFTDLQRVPAWLQMEAYWESTQSFSNSLGIRYAATNQSEWDRFSFGPVQADPLGPSPLIAWTNGTAMAEASLGIERGMTTELFHGRLDAAPSQAEDLCTPQTSYGKFCWSNQYVGVAASQRITIVYIAFYGYVPPEGWTFAADGSVPTPPS